MLLPTDQFNQEKFAKGAAIIALNNFHWQYATLVLFNSTLLCSVDVFLRFYQKNVIVGRGTFYPGFVKRVRQYVIFGADLPDIILMLTWMQRHQFDNTGTYIIVCQSEQWHKCNEVDVVNTLWEHKIINVVLINNRKEKAVNGFTYYEPKDCINTQPINIKNWDSCLLNGHQYCKNMYPAKLKNLFGCPIIVSTFNQMPYMNISNNGPTGADGDLLRVISSAMNFSLVIITPRVGYGWGIVDNNGNWTGSLADVYNEWANFSMTSPCMTLSRFKTFHMSNDYAVITVGWVTHPPEVQPSSLKLIRPFQPYVRIALGISFIMVVLLHIIFKSNLLSSLGPDLNTRIRFSTNIVLYSWELCMGLPISFFPINKASLCVALFWIWYCYWIRTFYQVCLISSLQTDLYAPVIDTIEESTALKYGLGGGLALRDYFINNDLVYDGWIKVESNEIHPIMVKLSQGLKFVLAMNVETIKMFLSSNPDKNLHVLADVVITSPTVIYFKKYSPLVNPLNVILSRLRESGVIQKIYMDNTGKNNSKEVLGNNIPITMAHYSGCYAILLIGWTLSSLCFMVEKLLDQKKKKLKSTPSKNFTQNFKFRKFMNI